MDDTITVYFDIDDTIAMWVLKEKDHRDDDIIIDGLRLRPHKTHIEMVKYHHARKRNLIAWSDGGSKWAYDVLQALNITQYFHAIMPKPKWAYDDKQPTEWTRTFFIGED